LIYMKNYYNHLPSESEKTEAASSWGISDEGYNCITVEDAKTLVTPYIITTENWKDFIEPYMEDIECYSYDQDDNEIYEVKQEPEIGISYDYYYSRSDIRLTLVNNNTGYEFEFYGTWGERVDLKDGKYYVTSYGDSGFGKEVEFNPDDYTCTLADGVVYQYDLPHELLFREYLDEEREEWVVESIDDGEFDEYDAMVFVQYGKKNSDICRVGYSGFGGYVYVSSNAERLLDEAEAAL